MTIPSLKLAPSAVSTAYSFRPLLRFPMVIPNYCSSTSAPSHPHPAVPEPSVLLPVQFSLFDTLYTNQRFTPCFPSHYNKSSRLPELFSSQFNSGTYTGAMTITDEPLQGERRSPLRVESNRAWETLAGAQDLDSLDSTRREKNVNPVT